MLRKMLALLLCLMFALIPAAQAAASTAYDLPEVGVSLTLPAQFDTVLTRDMPAEDPVFAATGLTKEYVDNLMIASNLYLDAMSITEAGVEQEIVFLFAPFTMIDTLADLSDADLEDFYSGIEMTYKAQGIVITNHEIVKVNGHPYVLMWEEANGATGIQCITVRNSLTVSVTLTNYKNATTLMDKLTVMSVLQSLKFAE